MILELGGIMVYLFVCEILEFATPFSLEGMSFVCIPPMLRCYGQFIAQLGRYCRSI